MTDIKSVKVGSGTKVHGSYGELPICGASVWTKRGYSPVRPVNAPVNCERCLNSPDMKGNK